MPKVHPFSAVQYQSGRGDVSTLIAPPYDVLDNAGKAALLARDASNIVGIDLPHTPAKELGPPSAYEGAAAAYRSMLAAGTLTRRAKPAMFAYRQTFTGADGATNRRCGMACTTEVVPFGPREGGGVLAHEETFSGPKEDRLALMKSTRTQLSPIFGLFGDDSGTATRIVRGVMETRQPDMTARMTTDNVLHEVWAIDDTPTVKAYQDALAGEDIFVADGHHRYTTQINYLAQLESQGKVPASHAARRSMMVLVGMSDPGLVIWPTHRVLGGMSGYTIEKFIGASASSIRFEPCSGDLKAVHTALHAMNRMGSQRFAVWDFKSKKGFVATPVNPEALASRFPEKPRAWRELPVAFCQYVIVEQVCEKALNAGQPVKWAFPHTIEEVEAIGSGAETGAGGGAGFAQVAIIVRPTPLQAVRDVSRANERMPQKSTFFFPKLATGLFLNALE